MKPFSEERDELAKINVRDSDIAVMDTYSDHEERFCAGYNACLKSQVVDVMAEALLWADEMFTARDEMNAKVHCAPLRLSPITERVKQARAAYEQALKEIEK